MQFFDFTPDPKVLIALTHTPMLPLDALCELIDNSIDSFYAAKIQGRPTAKPLIAIDLPARKDVINNTGFLRIVDNGPGMTAEAAEKAIRAGFSGNNPYDSLGLFGMGFNISTGKIGSVTRFRTGRAEDTNMIETIIDLGRINRDKDYRLPVNQTSKEVGFSHGTIIEISHWWPEGNPNRGFLSKLVQYGVPKIREEIGRRYATILREKEIQIIINSEKCDPFEHCIWDDSRYVERRDYGQIPAVFRFNQAVGNQRRCCNCTAIIPLGEDECPSCGSANTRTIEERVRGWIGIQRFDHDTDYGIDLIRNGRAIRIAEKNAFFEFVDEFKKVTKDYPIDQQYGRIVGEIHLDHVPVDFLKQDFQRSSDEWQRSMLFLRGNSSLQPTKPNADSNNSILFKLYQGYRRVRNFGKGDMYMGYWDPETNSAKRITRDIEREYYEYFKEKRPGYYDDAEWWKKVEEADTKPLEEMIECPECHSQNLKEKDVCLTCGHVLKGKMCISTECSQTIPISSQICPACGCSQVPVVEEPWVCDVCNSRNRSSVGICEYCGRAKGTPNTLSQAYLNSTSNKEDSLSLSGFSIKLANGVNSQPINVNVYITNEPIHSQIEDKKLPLIAFKNIGTMDIYVDKKHRVFRTFRIRAEEMIASEIAMYLYDSNRSLSNYKEHNLSSLSWSILEKGWTESLEISEEKTKNEIAQFMNFIKGRLPEIFGDEAEIYFDEMTEGQKKEMVDAIFSDGGDISRISEMKRDGTYLKYATPDFIVKLFDLSPASFMNGGIWSITFSEADPAIIGEEAMKHAQQRIKTTYKNCLEDVVMYYKYKSSESLTTQRAKLSLEFLKQKVVN